jgi:NMD protein affecting ribosome stability and mRNA decay
MMVAKIEEKGPKYFEGKLQLRNPTPEVLNYVYKKIAQDKHVWIAKEEKTKNGIDLWMSSNKFMLDLGKKLKKRFAGVLKTSKKLHTQHKITSKLLYRVTVLFKCLKFQKGDIIEVDGEQLKVVEIGTQVRVKNLTTGKKERWDPEVLERYVK